MTAVAAHTPTPNPAPTRRMSREDIVRLGQGGRAWEFLPVAAQGLRVAPGDEGLRLLAAANFAKVGLRTAALQHLELVSAAAGGVAELQRAVESLARDEFDGAVETCRGNVESLKGAGLDLSRTFEEWREANAGTNWFRASGGNILRRRADSWELLGDHAGAAKRFVAQHFGAGESEVEQRPRFTNVYLEGADPPWLLRLVAEATGRRKDGSWTRLVLVQADAMELLDGLALADLRAVLGEARLTVLVGRDAAGRLAEELWARQKYQIAGPVVPLMSLRTKATPGVDVVVRLAEQEQLREYERLSRQVRATYAGRDRAWWGRRFSSGEPLRVLVPTCRYSTYIQHASRDLVQALGRMGHRAELLIEPDDCSRLAAPAYLRALADLEPDLVVLINYTRANLGQGLFPPELPFVCWVQDAMPHQFSVETGRSLGAMDFVVGHLMPELFERYEFPRERTLSVPVVASTAKFHPGAVDPALARRYECEVAFLSHHSEPPEAMHARLCREGGDDPVTRTALELLRPRVMAIASEAGELSVQGRLREVTAKALAEAAGRDAPDHAVTLLLRQYALPLADRAIRHETLAWAAAVCERRGWRLHVYGRGWQQHPAFGRYARGEVDHGEELRAAYQCAGVHLHASVTTLNHQRVMECALSGGLPLCRLTADAMSVVRSCGQRAAAASGRAPAWEDGDKQGYTVAENADLMALTGLLQRLGLPGGAEFAVGKRRVASLVSRPPLEPESRPDWLLVELAETTFGSPAALEARVEHGLSSPEWRSGMSNAIAGRVRERLTHEVFAGRVLDLVRRSL